MISLEHFVMKKKNHTIYLPKKSHT